MSGSYIDQENKRGQVSVEYIMVVGFAFLMIIPLIVVFYSSSNDLNDQITSSQADKIANEIVAAADQVYFQGPPTMKTIKIFFPGKYKGDNHPGRLDKGQHENIGRSSQK